MAIESADAVVCGDSTVDEEALAFAKAEGKPVLDFPGEEDFVGKYDVFYDSLLEE